MQFELSNIDTSELETALASLGTATTPAMQNALQSAADVFTEFQRQQFVANASGAGWAPLAPSTITSGRSPPIFYGTVGRMYAALFERGADGHFEMIEPGAITFGAAGGSGEPETGLLCVYHHNGTRNGIPARPLMVDPDASTVQAINAILSAAVAVTVGQMTTGITGIAA